MIWCAYFFDRNGLSAPTEDKKKAYAQTTSDDILNKRRESI